MTFQWPWLLLFLLAVPALVAVYFWMLRKRRKFAVAFTDLSLIRAAMPARSRWRQHLPPALLLLALVGLVVGMARPQAVLKVPLSRTSIILALDVSRSMCATDVAPNRLTVAQDAARQFIEGQGADTQIGIVAFAGFAEIVVPPTDDKEALIGAIDRFSTSFGTAIGSATLKSIDAIAEINDDVAPAGVDLVDEVDRALLASGEKVPDIVVLLTDGANSQGVDPIAAAEQAADRRVRVYTIGFGTSDPTEMVCSAEQAGADFIVDQFGSGAITGIDPAGDFGQRGSGNFGGLRQFLVIDEPTLQGIAQLTGGEYYRAEDAEQLVEVFLNLPSQIELQEEELEVSVAFVALGAALALAAIVLSLLWNRQH